MKGWKHLCVGLGNCNAHPAPKIFWNYAQFLKKEVLRFSDGGNSGQHEIFVLCLTNGLCGNVCVHSHVYEPVCWTMATGAHGCLVKRAVPIQNAQGEHRWLDSAALESGQILWALSVCFAWFTGWLFAWRLSSNSRRPPSVQHKKLLVVRGRRWVSLVEWRGQAGQNQDTHVDNT